MNLVNGYYSFSKVFKIFESFKRNVRRMILIYHLLHFKYIYVREKATSRIGLHKMNRFS